MKKAGLLAICIIWFCSTNAQEIKYSNCNHCWDTDSLGNHRAVVSFNGEGKVAKLVIPWRRRDADPEQKRIIFQDARTKQKILNYSIEKINRESGIFYFQPVSGKGLYYVYYLPSKNEGRSNYPKGIYPKPEMTASAEWLRESKSSAKIPEATVTEMQSIDSLNSFYPMEVIATASETSAIKAAHLFEPFMVFPEDRMHPIRMTNDLPQRWIKKGSSHIFSGEANRGEWYAFQLGIYAIETLEAIKVSFTDLKSVDGEKIPGTNITCINTEGIKYDGTKLIKTVNVDAGKIQALWCGIDIPKSIKAGNYQGKAIVTANGKASKTINISLRVHPTMLADGGISEPWKQTRLQWLNSTLAQENTVIAPYTALEVDQNKISLLGRKIEINEDGLPKQIQTFFSPEMTSIISTPKEIITEAIHFHFDYADTTLKEKWSKSGVRFLRKEAGTVQWQAESHASSLQMEVNATLEFDGFLNYRVKLIALKDIDLKNIRFHLPFARESAKYMMGLGQKGGYRPDKLDWKWDVAHKNQDGAWVGDVNAGLQYSLRDEKYSRPLNTNFYLQKPLVLPSSWGNKGKGGINTRDDGKTILYNNYCGERSMKKGDSLFFNFTLLITPFHTINTDFQWDSRFFHSYKPIDTIKAAGASIANIHHATAINPWINYPFIEYPKMKSYIDEAHVKGIKVKIYNTVRELSNHAYETFAMRSLGQEIYSAGKGGGFNWLQEHLGDNYIAAWFVPEIKDAAIVNSGMSRWHNYYVEGMNWLTNQVGIDGIYLDDVAFDRITMKRIKRVLTSNQHPGIIDLHSANQYNKNDGFNNSANLYMEHFPYLNKLWFGEYFDYEKNSPDFFLTEVSGIPFGLMGEMLQDGGNPWRGMIYGMTNRMPWSDNADPRPIWKLWDEFGIRGSEMIGYWSDNCPVKTDHPKVLATVYKKKGSALISIASWADDDTSIQLNIDWKKLGLDPATITAFLPDAKELQESKNINIHEKITVKKGKGLFIVLK